MRARECLFFLRNFVKGHTGEHRTLRGLASHARTPIVVVVVVSAIARSMAFSLFFFFFFYGSLPLFFSSRQCTTTGILFLRLESSSFAATAAANITSAAAVRALATPSWDCGVSYSTTLLRVSSKCVLYISV